MAAHDVMDVAVRLSANTDDFEKALLRAAGNVPISVDTRDMARNFRSKQGDLQKSFATAIKEAAQTGMRQADLHKITRKLAPIGDSIASSMREVVRLQAQMTQMQAQGLDVRLQREHKALLEAEQEKLKGLHRRFEIERRNTDLLVERRTKGIQEAERLASRTMAERLDEMTESIESTFDQLRGGNVSALLKRGGGALATRGVGMEAAGAAGGGKMMASIGSGLAKLGPALIAMAGVAALLGAIVKVALDAEQAMKEVHQSFMESGGSAGELAARYGTVSEGLARLRDTFISSAFAFNAAWGTTAKDHMEILGAYEQMGLTLRKITADARDANHEMALLQESTQAALMYARLFGTSNTEMATNLSSYMEDLGQTLDGIQRSFASIHLASRDSGFGVKRFFNMVLQATSGMSMYNVRLEEASALLVRLGQVLGAKQGGEFLSQLTKGFGDASLQDNYKRVLTTGTGRTKATFGRSAENTANDFLDKLTGPNGVRDTSGLSTAASKAGIKLDPSSADKLVSSLGKLSKEDQTRLLAEARQTMTDQQVQQLTNLIGVSQGAGGNVGVMAQNLGSLDMGGKLMMQLQQGMAVIGKPLHEMSTEQLMAFENITGVSGEQLEQLRRVSQAMYGNFDVLKSIQSSGIEPTPWEKEQQVKAYGAFVENGNIVAARLDENGQIDADSTKVLGDDIGSYIQSQGDVFKKAAQDAKPEDIRLAQDQVSATVSVAHILEQGIEWVLNEIYTVISQIWGWLSSSGDKDAAAAAQRAAGDKIGAQKKKSALLARAEQMRREGAPQEEIDKVLGLKGNAALQENVGRRLESEIKKVNPDDILLGPVSPESIRDEALRDLSTEDLEAAYKGAGMDPQAAIQKFSSLTPEQVSKIYGKQLGYTGSEPLTGDKVADLIRSGQAPGLGPDDYFRDDVAQSTKALYEDEMSRAQKGQFGLSPKEAMLLGAGQTPLTAFKDLAYTGTTAVTTSPRALDGARGARMSVLSPEDVEEISSLSRKSEESQESLFKSGGPGAKGIGSEVGKELDRVEKERQVTDLVNALNSAGVSVSYSQAEKWQRDLSRHVVPDALRQHLDKSTGAGTVRDALQSSGIFSGPKANDFLMHVSSSGQVKMAQRIDGQDTVAVATKSNGALATAARAPGGSGGSTVIVQHIYAGEEAARKGFRVLANAKVI